MLGLSVEYARDKLIVTYFTLIYRAWNLLFMQP